MRRLQQLAAVPGALLFYESPYRVAATLESIARVFPARTAALCRELTKLHEEVLRAPAPELAAQVAAREQIKGEIVLVVAPPRAEELAGAAPGAMAMAGAPAYGADGVAPDPEDALRADIADGLAAGEPAGALSKRLAQKYSRRKREVYALILEMQ